MAARKAAPAAASLLVVSLALSSMVLGLLLLAGCGGDAKPDASSSSTTASSPTTTAMTTVSPTTDPNIPAAARAHTPAGAEAFVRYFYSQLNVAWSTPKSGLVSVLSLPTCKTCTNFEAVAKRSATKQERILGESVVLDTVSTSDATNLAKLTVLAIGYQPKTVVVDTSGKTVETVQRERVRTLVTARWGANGWLIAEIQSIA